METAKHWLFIIVIALIILLFFYSYIKNERIDELRNKLKIADYELNDKLKDAHAEINKQQKYNDKLINKLKELESDVTSLKKKLKDEITNSTLMKENFDTTISEYQLSFLNVEQDIQKKFDILKMENPNTFPYVASLMADYLTYNIHKKEIYLLTSPKYHERQRAAKINEIRQETKSIIEELKVSQYHLDYLLQLYPDLKDVINYDYNHTPSLDEIKSNQNAYIDNPIKNYLSLEEWENLSETEKNQLALDRYIESRKKSKWQIGRDYELYIGYLYEQKGYKIDYFGSYMGLEDLGRDLIAKKNGKTLIIQCKYWSKEKQIHEKHIMQLYGSLIAYKIENNSDSITALLVTNIQLSETARKFADMLNINYVENKDIGDFPRIKCNIGHDEYGKTFIYHLPMDFQYDKTKIEAEGEKMVFTVAEAESLGFRRTYKWHGDST